MRKKGRPNTFVPINFSVFNLKSIEQYQNFNRQPDNIRIRPQYSLFRLLYKLFFIYFFYRSTENWNWWHKKWIKVSLKIVPKAFSGHHTLNYIMGTLFKFAYFFAGFILNIKWQQQQQQKTSKIIFYDNSS